MSAPDTGTTGIEERDGRRVFVKDHPDPPPRLLEFEAVGLRALVAAGARVPQVLALRETELVTTVVGDEEAAGAAASATPSDAAGRAGGDGRDPGAFGRELAALHRTTNPAGSYGALDGNPAGWLGACPIDLTPRSTLADSLLGDRVLPLVRRAVDAGVLDPAAARLADRLDADHLGPAEPPTLVHGDLWAGNRMVDAAGRSWLIDPSAHHGHREEDLAMMQLFGGFTPAELAAYDETFPLAEGWRDRVGTFQLVPLLVHALLFGGGYGAQTLEALRRVA